MWAIQQQFIDLATTMSDEPGSSSSSLTANSKCKFCGEIFVERKECIRHEKTCDKFYTIPLKKIPSTASSEEQNVIKCKFCSKSFGLKRNCTRHEISCQSNPDTASSAAFSCSRCGAAYNRKDNFSAHQKKCLLKSNPPISTVSNNCLEPTSNHEGTKSNLRTPAPRSKTPCLLPECDLEFFHKNALIEHLKACHKEVDVKDPITKTFNCISEFHKWKDAIQEETFSYFCQKSGQSSSRVKYFYCQHDGLSHNERKTSRCNKKGRVKVGHHCIAKMQVWKDDYGLINVNYEPTHNHVCSSADFVHQPVPQDLSMYINEKLLWGVTPHDVLKDVMKKHIPKTLSIDNIKNCKAAILTKKRIAERARKMREKRRFHKDEAKALFLMVEQLSKEEDCIVLYKPFNHEVKHGPKEIDHLPDSKSLFMLGIQTKRQAKLLAEHCHKIVLVDETHGTNHHKYQLLTLMVIDDNRRGWPVAHLITSKSDADTLQFFFKALKVQLPDDLQFNCIISDDDPALINSMNKGFGQNLRHILCKWHLLKNFKKNLRSYVPLSMVDHMMDTLRIIINEENESEFLKLLNGFYQKYEKSPQCSDFIEYFSKHYKNRAEKWAMCYRRFPHSNVNTTGHIESFHNRLKKVYLKRKVNKRLDDLVTILLDIEWDDHVTRVREATNGMAYLPQDILSRHKRGMDLKDEDFRQLEETTWDVSSKTSANNYHVVRYSESCCSDLCFSKCAEVPCTDLCAHLYSCSCPDNHPLCKHIHKLHSMLLRETPKQMRDNETLLDNVLDSEGEKNEAISNSIPDSKVPCGESIERKLSKQRETLSKNIAYLENLLTTSNSNALSHAVAISNDLVLQLKYMCEGEGEEITQMEPAVKFNPNEKLQTQASQISSFKKPPKKKKNQKGIGPVEKKAIIDDLLAFTPNNDFSTGFSPDSPVPFEMVARLQNQITPPLSSVSDPRDVLLKCGYEKISLLQLKSLEINLPEEDLKICKELDSAFNVGWLYSSVINTYLASLEEKYPSCVAFSSDLALRASRGLSNEKIIRKTLTDQKQKSVLMFPANVSGMHWCIIAVTLNSAGNARVNYYDPLQNVMCGATQKLVIQMNTDMKGIFPSLSEWKKVTYVQTSKQNDSINCGVHICSFAEQMVKKSQSYVLVTDVLSFRKSMYKVIVGGCLKWQHSEDKCGTCHTLLFKEDEDSPCIACNKCDQWYHERCVASVSSSGKFQCPTDT